MSSVPIRRAALILAGLAFMLFLAGLGKVWHRWHSSGGERRKIVERLTGPTGAALIIGDSITQQQEISSLCGLPVVNAGIASSRVEDWTSLAPEVVRKLKPKIVIYALGINDARTHFPFNADQWARTYSKLRRGGFILGVLPVQNHPTISNERIAEMNARLSREPGFIPPFPTDDLTRDGVHLNLAGKRRWERQVQMVCTRQAKPSDKHPIKA